MRALRMVSYGPPSALELQEIETPQPGPGEILLRVMAAGVNPSDARNIEGVFKTPLPRTPGRDVAGIADGIEIWSTSAGVGFEREGGHAEYVVLERAAARPKPNNLSFAEAAACGTPFLTAWLALVRLGGLRGGETLLVTGAAGSVGSAAVQIGKWRGVRVIAAARKPDWRGEENRDGADAVVDLLTTGLRDGVLAATGGHGADVTLDTIGGALFEPALSCAAPDGRHLVMASPGAQVVSFNLVSFYHRRLRMIGVDSLHPDAREVGSILDELRPGFESGMLRTPEIETFPLERAREAYEQANRGGVKPVLTMLP